MRKVLARILCASAACGLLAYAGVASADLAAGTPLFTCTLPTQNVDGTTIGTADAIKSVKFFVDGVLEQTNISTTTAPPLCSWQTVFGDISYGSHNIQASVVNALGQESAKTTNLPLDCANCRKPVPRAPTGLSVQ